MRIDEMTSEQRTRALVRHERAAEIIADHERQHGRKLPAPWVEAVSTLLLQGLGDPELHLIFETIGRVEHDAGLLGKASE